MDRFPGDVESQATLDDCQYEGCAIGIRTYNSTRDGQDEEVGDGKGDLLRRGKVFPLVHHQPEDGGQSNCSQS